MSSKRKFENLQQLGILKDRDVKKIQAALGQPTVATGYITMASVRWSSLAIVVGLAYGSLAIVIGVAWKLSH